MKRRSKQKHICMWQGMLKANLKDAKWVAPVNAFKHVPFASTWETFARPNLMIELPVPEPRPLGSSSCHWFGIIKGFAGYKAWVVYHQPVTSNSSEPSKPVGTWIQFCGDLPKPFFHSLQNDILLHPPAEMMPGSENLEEVIERTLRPLIYSEAMPPETINDNHQDLVDIELARCSSRFNLGEYVEAIDKDDCSIYRFGVVTCIIGDRLQVTYFHGDESNFWFSSNSHHINKFGWCKAIGAPLRCPSPQKISFPDSESIFEGLNLPITPPECKIEEQMIFEMRHPIKPYKLCSGYVVKVLKHGYFIAATDWTRKNELVEVVLHASTDYVLPLGFCRKHRIPMEIPKDAKDIEDVSDFSWKTYMVKDKLKELDTSSIPKGPNKFIKGSKLEAVFVVDPQYIRPATVVQVAGRLIRIHFDEYTRQDKKSFQWVSCDSGNIYPVGYAEMVGHIASGEPTAPKAVDHIQTGRKVDNENVMFPNK